MSLKYLSNFWRSPEMPLINWKVELNFKWTNYFQQLDDNENGNHNCIISTIKDTKLYVVPVVTLLTRDYQKLSEFLSKGFERIIYWNEYETKSGNKNTIN